MAPFSRPCSEMKSWGGSLKKKETEQCHHLYSPEPLLLARSRASSPEDCIHYSQTSSEYSTSTSMSTSTSSSTSSRYAKAVDLSESPAIQRVNVTSVNKETNFKLHRQASKNGLQPILTDMAHDPSGGEYPDTASLNSLISTLMCRFQPNSGVEEEKPATSGNDPSESPELVNQRRCDETEKWMNTNATDPPPALRNSSVNERNGSVNDALHLKSTHQDARMNIKQESSISVVQTSFNKVRSERVQPMCASSSATNPQWIPVHRDALIDKAVAENLHPFSKHSGVDASCQALGKHSVLTGDTIPIQQRRPLAPTARWNNVRDGFPVKMHVKHTGQHHEHPPSNYMRDAYTEISPSILCRRDMGTQMTPSVCSANSSRRLSPPRRGGSGQHQHKSPLRHNTPVKSLGTECSLAVMDSSQGTQQAPVSRDCYPSIRVEEISMSSSRAIDAEERYPERRDVLDAQTNAWREAARLKVLARYEREELKIRAWEEHQAAKAEAELKKLQMELERERMQRAEKIVRKLESMRRRGEVLRATARAKEMQALAACDRAEPKLQKDRLQLFACLSRGMP